MDPALGPLEVSIKQIIQSEKKTLTVLLLLKKQFELFFHQLKNTTIVKKLILKKGGRVNSAYYNSILTHLNGLKSAIYYIFVFLLSGKLVKN